MYAAAFHKPRKYFIPIPQKPSLFNALFLGILVYLSRSVHEHRQILQWKNFICSYHKERNIAPQVFNSELTAVGLWIMIANPVT